MYNELGSALVQSSRSGGYRQAGSALVQSSRVELQLSRQCTCAVKT